MTIDDCSLYELELHIIKGLRLDEVNTLRQIRG